MIPLLIIFNGNISDVVGKRGRILVVVIFIFDISFQNFGYVFPEILQREPLYKRTGRIRSRGWWIFG